jgi:hypothetical protein
MDFQLVFSTISLGTPWSFCFLVPPNLVNQPMVHISLPIPLLSRRQLTGDTTFPLTTISPHLAAANLSEPAPRPPMHEGVVVRWSAETTRVLCSPGQEAGVVRRLSSPRMLSPARENPRALPSQEGRAH